MESLLDLEHKLDQIFLEKSIIPVYEVKGYHKILIQNVGEDNYVTSMRIMRKFCYLNVFPIKYDPVIWSGF